MRAPFRFNLFHFHAVFGNDLTKKSGVGTPVWEILDPPLDRGDTYPCPMPLPSLVVLRIFLDFRDKTFPILN